MKQLQSFSLPNWSKTKCASYLQPCLTSDWLCIPPAGHQAMRVTLEGSHVVVLWGFCCTKCDSFLLIFGRSISKGTLSTSCGLKLYPAVLQGQRNFSVCRFVRNLNTSAKLYTKKLENEHWCSCLHQLCAQSGTTSPSPAIQSPWLPCWSSLFCTRFAVNLQSVPQEMRTGSSGVAGMSSDFPTK